MKGDGGEKGNSVYAACSVFILQECVFQGVNHTVWRLLTRGFKRASDANTQPPSWDKRERLMLSENCTAEMLQRWRAGDANLVLQE